MQSLFAQLRARMAAGADVARSFWLQQYQVYRVVVDVSPLQMPHVCAHCLAAATVSRREASPSGSKTINVPYCDACTRIFERREMARLGVYLAALLLAVSGCLFLPLQAWLSQSVAVILAGLLAGGPGWFAEVWAIRQRRGLRGGRAVALTEDAVLTSNAQFAALLAQTSQQSVETLPACLRPRRRWLALVTLLPCFITWQLHDVFHCETRIVNLTEDDLDIVVDGHSLGFVKASMQEHPLAGILLRVASGKRHIRALRRDGTLIDEDWVRFAAGQSYLYAPAHPSSVCFWLERAALGRGPTASVAREPLPGHLNFWEMPVAIDTWFMPATGPRSRFFTGGIVASLRQGPCDGAANGAP